MVMFFADGLPLRCATRSLDDPNAAPVQNQRTGAIEDAWATQWIGMRLVSMERFVSIMLPLVARRLKIEYTVNLDKRQCLACTNLMAIGALEDAMALKLAGTRFAPRERFISILQYCWCEPC